MSWIISKNLTQGKFNWQNQLMHTKSGSKEIMINDKADKVIKILF